MESPQNKANSIINLVILKETLPELMESMAVMATVAKSYHTALVQEGFTPEQATFLVNGWQQALLNGAKGNG